MRVAERLMAQVEEKRPDLYRAILWKIRPHRLDSVLRLFENHLRRIDLNLLNEHRDVIPEFCWAFVKHLKFPTPGDAFGIQLTCRITKSDTQGTLDSKHLPSPSSSISSSGGGRDPTVFHVEKSLSDELGLFSTQLQVFELANRHRYATVYLTGIDLDRLLAVLPGAGRLHRGDPFNKGRDLGNGFRYLDTFRFLLVEDRGSLKVLYQASKDLFLLLRYVSPDRVVGFSDIRYLFQKCGIVCHFFNLVEVVRRQMWNNDGSVYERDVLTVMKYQCRSGTPLPLTRDGLAKNPDRTPLEVLSFEAPKKNFARLSTGPQRERWYDVETSSDKIFFGQQFNEGTGYSFALMDAGTRPKV